MLDGEWPEELGEACVMKKSSGVLVDVASGSFGDTVHFLMFRRRRLDCDALLEAEGLELGDQCGIVLDERLIAIHADLQGSSEFEHGGFERLQEVSFGEVLVESDVGVATVAGEAGEVDVLGDAFDEGTVRIHVKSLDGVIFPVAPSGTSGISG